MKTEIIGIKSQASQNGSLNDPAERPGDRADENIDGGGSGVNTDSPTVARNSSGGIEVFSRAVKRYALFFDRPEARNRFVNNTLAKQADRQERMEKLFLRFHVLGRLGIYGWFLEARSYSALLEEMREMRSDLPKERRHLPYRIQVPFSARLFFLFHQTRHAFYGATAISMTLMVLVIFSFGMRSVKAINKSLENMYRASAPAPAPSPTPNPKNDLFFASEKEKPFFVETEGGREKWSNGCVISTNYETDNHPRSYYVIPRGSKTKTDGDQISNRIAGIVYHTPESFMVDFIPNNNKAIQQSSRALLEYVQRHKSYNYVINRIGDIYRIVRDDQAANHAGESLWADENNIYVFLNESFLGVCFEAKFEGANSLDDILTTAQIRSGRLLTDVLRTKYKIDDADCTTHGLVAIEPDTMLIARHHDWVRFFPFETMGLSDKYKTLPPTIIDYGFTHNDDLMAKIGNKLWAGAIVAEDEFIKRAKHDGVNPDDMRHKLIDRYISQRNKVYGLHHEHGESNNSRLNKKPAAAADGVPADSGDDQSGNSALKSLQ